MRARDIQVKIELVDRQSSVAAASRKIAAAGRIGAVVAGPGGRPQGVITALDLFRLALPDYLVDDSSLAAMLDEEAIAELIEPLREKTIDEVLKDDAVRLRRLPEVDADATVLEIAAVLVSADCLIAAVAGTSGDQARFVTLPTVLDAVLSLTDSPNGPA